MTEDEAKTKICHKILSVMPANAAIREGHWCIGSTCMAWRGSYTMMVHNIGADVGKPPSTPVQVKDGYCGLASKP